MASNAAAAAAEAEADPGELLAAQVGHQQRGHDAAQQSAVVAHRVLAVIAGQHVDDVDQPGGGRPELGRRGPDPAVDGRRWSSGELARDAIDERIVGAMGGTITVQSQIGTGSAFTFTPTRSGTLTVAGGGITIDYGNEVNQTVSAAQVGLTPGASANGDVIWKCGTAQDPSGWSGTTTTATDGSTSVAGKYLPSSCR